MDALLLQNDSSWTHTFLGTLEKRPHLKWLSDKIMNDPERTHVVNEKKRPGKHLLVFLKMHICTDILLDLYKIYALC